MKPLLVLFIVLFVSIATFAQNNPRPSKSRFWLNKHSTFVAKPGDILVYSINNNEEKHELLITVKSFTDAGINFDYNIPSKNKRGSVSIPSASILSGVTYENFFASSIDNIKDKGALWLSKDNYRQLAAGSSKQTKMDVGNGSETFIRQAGSVQKINYKGREKILTVFKVTNEGVDKKEFSVLTDINNPLIVNWGNGAIVLKEVR